jgi:uncharacterized protein (DUF433 family)
MSANATTYQYLEPHVGSSYKQLFIKGTKLRAYTIYSAAYQRGDKDDRTPEQVAEDYGIPVEAVYEAIRYCASNPAEVAYDHRHTDLLIEAAGMNHPDYKTDPKTHYRMRSADDNRRIEEQLRAEFGTDFLSYTVEVRPRSSVPPPA